VTKKHNPDTVLIVDGMLVSIYDRAVTASSKNYRYSVNMQVVIDADTRLTVAVGAPTPATATTVAPTVTRVLTSSAAVRT
jgi:hypothetical protein